MSGKPVRDRKFRHELFPGSAPLVALAEAVIASTLQHEQETGARRRARRPADLASFRNAVAVIVANLAHAVVFPAEGRAIILPTGHAKGERIGDEVAGFGKTLGATIEAMEGAGVLRVMAPEKAFHATAVGSTEGFMREVEKRGIAGSSDFLRRQVLDPICLSRKDAYGRRERFSIPETREADAARSEVRGFGEWLSGADLGYVGAEMIDTGDRRLRRHFNLPPHVAEPCLSFGGRLFGGFWQPMKRNLRQHIRIGGERVAELDYGQIVPRLAYAEVGAEPPDGDLYELGSASLSRDHRSGVKRAFNALLFASRRLKAWPLEIVDKLPDGLTVGQFRNALCHRHPALGPLLEQGVGHALMNRESTIICGVLRRCMNGGIVVLPIHDAVVCPASSVMEVRRIMGEEALSVSGQFIPVGVEYL